MLQLGIIHTSTETLEQLQAMTAERMSSVEVAKLIDTSILPSLARCGNVNQVAGRLIQYARFAEQIGAGVILNACSSVGEVVARTRAAVNILVIRIDEALAGVAVARASKLGVAATRPTTLNLTTRMLEAKAREASRATFLQPRLPEVESARVLSSPRLGMECVRQAIVANARGNEPGVSGRPRRIGPP
jgi:aspartate/glutamate racemase